MSTASNITDLAAYRQRMVIEVSEQELVDDVCARTFLFLRDEATAAGVPIPTVIAEHLLGMALVVESVEGADSAKALLAAVTERLGTDG